MTETRRGGYAKGRERREAILRAANELFAAQGFHGTSLASIATKVGLSEPGLLHHFPSKEHLLLEVLRYREDQGLEHVAHALEEHHGYADALLELCAANAQTPGLVRLFTVLAAEGVDDDHPAHELFRERYRDLRRLVASRFATEQREGRIAADLDPDSVAPQVLALFDGLQLQWLLDPDEVDMVGLLRDYLERLR